MLFLVGKSCSGRKTLANYIAQKYNTKGYFVYPELVVVPGLFSNSLVIKIERNGDFKSHLKADFIIENNDEVEVLQEKFDTIFDTLYFQQY